MAESVLLGAPKVREFRTPTRVGKTYWMTTFGCQMNDHDSERIAGLFESDGMQRSDDRATADVVFVNTCTIRENADNKLYGTLGHLAKTKRENPGSVLVVGGCAAQKDRDLIREKAPWVDVVLGTHNLERVLPLIDHAQEWGPITEVVEQGEGPRRSELPAHRDVPYAAWLTIQTGCNNSCTFCIVPSVRGSEISRRPGDVIREARALAADGVVEVTLLGQNVNTYGRDLAIDGKRRPIFGELLRRVGELDGIERVRYTSPHPADMSEDVALAMAETPSVCNQMHFPLQSGSKKILSAMRRGYTPQRYLERLEMMRSHVPEMTVTTDIIVGFPGETEADLEGTLEVVRQAQFDSAFTFQFSARPGTRAAEMQDTFIPHKVVQERFERLVELQNAISLELNQHLIGTRQRVLCEGPSRKNPETNASRTEGGKLVHFSGQVPAGEFVDVVVQKAGAYSASGTLA